MSFQIHSLLDTSSQVLSCVPVRRGRGLGTPKLKGWKDPRGTAGCSCFKQCCVSFCCVRKGISFMYIWMSAQLLSHVPFFATQWTIAHQGPLSMEFSRQEYWRRLPFLTPWNLPWHRDCSCISWVSYIGGQILYHCAIWEAPICVNISPLFWISFPFRSAQSIEYI